MKDKAKTTPPSDEVIACEVVLSRNDLDRDWNHNQRTRNSVIVALDDRVAERNQQIGELLDFVQAVYDAETKSHSSTLAELAEDGARALLAKHGRTP